MNKLTFFRTLATLVACLALALPASAYDFAKDGIYYAINGTNALVTFKDTNYNSYSGTVIIPSTVTYNGTTYNVVQINPYAFKDCTGLKRVVLPPTIKYLMNYAFQNCTGLTNITLPADFYACYSYVFDGCTNLKSIICLSPTPHSWNISSIPSSVLSSATLIVPQGKKDAYQSVDGCLSAFTNIEEMDCDFGEDAIFYEDLGNNKAAVTHALRFAEDYSGDIEIPEVVVHNGTSYSVTSVSKEAFFDCHELYSVKLPATVNNIDTYAFYDCNNLTDVNIPQGVEDINYCSFSGCIALQEIIIPSSVTWIAQNAFNRCTSLTSITCRATTPPMCVDNSCFPSSAYSNATLYVPAATLSDYQSTSVWQSFSNIVGKTYDFEANGIYYIITGPNTASVTYRDTDFNSYSGSITIPSTVNHNGTPYTVTAIGRSAFRESPGLTSVSIPSTVTLIDYASFYKCTALTSVTVPGSVATIGEQAFRETGISQIAIPNGVTTISYGAFYNCASLTSISIPNSVTTLGEMCFQRCTSMTSASIGTGLTEIPRQCFAMCNSLSSVNIPSTVKIYRNFSFYNTGFTTLNITEGVDTIGYSAFSECEKLTSITFPASARFIDNQVLSYCDALAVINVNSANPNYCAVNNELYDKAKTRLMRYAPQKPDDNTTTPNTCVAIATGAYDGAVNLDHITIGTNVEYIGYNAFNRCSSLTAFYIEDGNTHYMTDDGVLYSMNSAGKPLAIIKYPAKRPEKHYSVLNTTDTVSGFAFAQTLMLQSVYIPKQLKELGTSSFTSSSAKRVVIDEGLTRIQDYAFDNCDSLQSVYLPSTVTSIGEQAFIYAFNLSEITFGGTTPPAIEANAFYGTGYYEDNPVTIYVPAGTSSAFSGLDWNSNYFSCTISEASQLPSGTDFTVDSLKYQTTDAVHNAMVTGIEGSTLTDPGIPPKVAYQGNLCTVTMLKDHAFAHNFKIVRAEVPFTVQQIDDYCFYDCRYLEKLILRDGVRQIDGYAFSHINKLEKVNIPVSVDSITGNAFTYDPKLKAINVPDANPKYTSVDGILFSKDKKRLLAYADGHPTAYEIPDGTQSIGREAFRGATALEIISMPTSLRKIEGYAFHDCSTLHDVEVPKGVTTIENYAFGSCTSLDFITLPSTLTELDYSAFYNATSLTQINVKATTPPTCLTYMNPRTGEVLEPFIADHYANVNLQVPMGCGQAYRTANVWKKFTNINETDFPAEFIRGDVNNDGQVNIADVTALIDLLLSSNASVNANAADANQDGSINIADVTSLIDYLLNGKWSEAAAIDMWYLIGDRVGSNPLENQGVISIGRGLIPLYPVGEFDEYGKGQLSYTGFFGANDAVMLIHHPGSKDDCWGYKPSGIFGHGGEEITAIKTGQDGYFNIMLNTKTDSFYFYPYNSTAMMFNTINIVGYHSDWAVTDPTYNMTKLNPEKENHNWIFRNFTLANDSEVKFAADNDWSNNWGAETFPFGRGVQGGVNIPVKAGTYDVYFNDITGDFNFIKK